MEHIDINAMIASAVELEDQSVENASQFNDEPIAAGKTVGRFIEYIECGKHPQKDYMGKAKPDAEIVRLTFELLHPTKNIKEYEVDGVTQKSGQLISIRLRKTISDKAKFKKLFNKMVYGRDSIKHMAQMLGEAFVIEIYHNVEKVDGKDKLYVNLDKDGEYGIGAPFVVDAMTEQKTAYNVPAHIRPLKLFLWMNPIKATWDSLFIDGTREQKNADGSVEQISKNWLQELIMSATNFKGSLLHNMLGGVDELPMTDALESGAGLDDEIPFEAPAEKPVEKAAAKPAETKAAPEKAKAKPVDTSASDDALAALGLVS